MFGAYRDIVNCFRALFARAVIDEFIGGAHIECYVELELVFICQKNIIKVSWKPRKMDDRWEE